MSLDTTGGNTDAPQAKKPSNSVMILGGVAGVIGMFIGIYLSNYAMANWHNYQVDQQLVQTVAGLNKKVPQMIDEVTRLDEVSAPGHQRIVYHYTLIPTANMQFDAAKVTGTMRPVVLKAYLTNDALKTFRDNGVTMEYDYSDTSGHKITQFEVGPADLK